MAHWHRGCRRPSLSARWRRKRHRAPGPRTLLGGGHPRRGATLTSIAKGVRFAPASPPAPRPGTAALPDPPDSSTHRPRHYWPGLDGLRALAVTAVVAYHLDPSLLPGGFYGVDVFFVISGYLITSLLAEEWTRRASIDLKQFWLRRARRLLPAVVALLVILTLVSAVVAPDALAPLRGSIPAALFYVTNWWFIFHHVSYFQSVGRPPLLLHFWSLAIEEQYYLLWPPLLAFVLVRWRRPGRVAALAMAGACASCVLMALLYHPGVGTNRLYFGTDTHSQGLLVGSALGLLIPPGRMSGAISSPARRWLDRIGLGAMAALVILMVVLSQAMAVTWRIGFALVAVLSGLIVLVVIHPASRLAKALGCRPLRWLGTRSYSLYLWHWPIIDLTRPHVDVSLSGAPLLVLRIGLMVVATEGSYRLIEQPWRSGRAQRALASFFARARPAYRWGGLASMTAPVVLVIGLLVAATPAGPPIGLDVTATAAASHSIASASHAIAPAGPTPWSLPALGTPLPTLAKPADPRTTPARLAQAAPTGPVLAIGDSVMLGASSDLQAALGPGTTIDARVGRQVQQGLTRLAAYRAAGRLKGLGAVVIDLGSNGPLTLQDFQQLVALTEGVGRVVVVNVRVPRPWQSITNDSLAAGVAANPRFVLVNWYRASAAPGLLYPDQIHPDPKGQLVYADLVARAVRSPG